MSSAEAEFYAMVDAVLKAKWLVTVAHEMGMAAQRSLIILGTDSSAARSFVCRRGLGRMRHIEIRDLWLQKEVLKGLVKVVKIPGESNPADLMTKFLNAETVKERLKAMNLRTMPGNPIRREGTKDKAVKKRWADEEGGAGEEACFEVVEWWRRKEKK